MLLDEPTAALDVGARDEIRLLIRNSIHDLAIPAIIVTHDFGDVTTMATHVAAMDAGQLVACVNVAEAQAAPPTAFVARLAQTAGVQSGSSLENPPAPIFQSSRRSL
jgi:molybdate transport system permease protein